MGNGDVDDLRASDSYVEIDGKSCDGGGRLVVSELVQQGGKPPQRGVHVGKAARVVVVADCQGEEVKGVSGIAAGGRKGSHGGGSVRLELSIAAHLRDPERPT